MALRTAGRDGEGDALDRNRLHTFIFRGRIGIHVQLPGNRGVRNAGNAGGHLVSIAHIEELRFYDGHLDRDADDHFLTDASVSHILVVGIDRHVVGGQFV